MTEIKDATVKPGTKEGFDPIPFGGYLTDKDQGMINSADKVISPAVFSGDTSNNGNGSGAIDFGPAANGSNNERINLPITEKGNPPSIQRPQVPVAADGEKGSQKGLTGDQVTNNGQILNFQRALRGVGSDAQSIKGQPQSDRPFDEKERPRDRPFNEKGRPSDKPFDEKAGNNIDGYLNRHNQAKAGDAKANPNNPESRDHLTVDPKIHEQFKQALEQLRMKESANKDPRAVEQANRAILDEKIRQMTREQKPNMSDYLKPRIRPEDLARRPGTVFPGTDR